MPVASEQEALYLQQRALTLDAQIQDLHQQRAQTLYQLNSIQSSTRVLPWEILEDIFHHIADPAVEPTSLDYCRQLRFRTDIEKYRSIVRCASVCFLWRRIILSTPALWKTLVMNVKPSTVPSDREMLKLCWERSGNLPLALDLHFRGAHGRCWDRRFWDEMRPLYEEVFKGGSVGRIRMLRLYDPPIVWIRRLCRSWLPGLECLFLEGLNGFNNRATLELSNLHGLRQLTLRGMRHIDRILHPHNLAVLDLFETSMDICIDVFMQCPTLTECHCRAPTILPSQHSNITSDAPMVFPHLKTLTWSLRDTDGNRMLLQQIRLPALQVLRLDGDANCGRTIPVQSVTQFFHHLPSRLSSLELVNWMTWEPESLVEILGSINDLNELMLRECFETFCFEVVRMLALEGPNKKPSYLPNLALLSIQTTTIRRHLGKLPELMKKRGSKRKPFRLAVSRPQLPAVRELETRAASRNGRVDLKFLDMFTV